MRVLLQPGPGGAAFEKTNAGFVNLRIGRIAHQRRNGMDFHAIKLPKLSTHNTQFIRQSVRIAATQQASQQTLRTSRFHHCCRTV